jgi:two-component system OmpR family sensor kinase
VLEVADDGPGIGPEERERVFERFWRADRARSRSKGGSGLGLAIVASLVEAHGGRIQLESAPGKGATFTVRLPIARPSQATDESRDAAERDADSTARPDWLPVPPPRTALPPAAGADRPLAGGGTLS